MIFLMFRFRKWFCLIAGLILVQPLVGSERLAFQYAQDPFFVGQQHPAFTTPQWVGEEGVEAVVIISIDDMRTPEKYRTFLAPIAERLKEIYGEAPISIFCNALEPDQPAYVEMLREGMSLEIHTLAHPCPLLQKHNFQSAMDNVLGCVDLLSRIPGNRPVAFRMPCCDSINSASPRFYNEILPLPDGSGNLIYIDSSIMNITTSADTGLDPTWVRDEDGGEKFAKYVPFPDFKTTIENYPWPYLVGNVWEFPAAAPSDWEAQNIHGVNNPLTVEDWKRQLDVTVAKQGVMTMVIHPHGWIKNDQIVELIDYAHAVYGNKVAFLNFAQVLTRLEENALNGMSARSIDRMDGGVRLFDVNGDGFQDVLVSNEKVHFTRVWDPADRVWSTVSCPFTLIQKDQNDTLYSGVHFGQFSAGEGVFALKNTSGHPGAWQFENGQWRSRPELFKGLEMEGFPLRTGFQGRDNGFRLMDLDGDGSVEALIANQDIQGVFKWNPTAREWIQESFSFPEGVRFVDKEGRDHGLRLVDLNGDGFLDILQSNTEGYSVHAFLNEPALHWDFARGWAVPVREGTASDPKRIPPLVREGDYPSNGAWFKDGKLWVQNEDTAHLDGLVEVISFQEILSFDTPPPLSPEQALLSFQVPSGFEVELIASEPIVRDPVAFDWDGKGRLWVVEMGDYPTGINETGDPGGNIQILEDRDRDGVMDHSTLFLEGLNFPTGLHPWRDGVFISAAPDILFAVDRDGDGRADQVDVVFTGFTEGNQQHRVNGFQWGLDGWLYGANGDSGGMISGGTLDKAVNLRGYDFRFHPDEKRFETIPGQSQFARNRDDWGNWFGNNNPNWLWHYDVPVDYFQDDGYTVLNRNKRMLADHEKGTEVFPTSQPMRRFNWPHLVNTLTSACSPSPYRDDLFGDEHSGSVFIAEPAHNLVHTEILSRDGVSFTSQHGVARDGVEFLTSTDVWFRPTTVKTGPDGALYVADMYRLVIEHPDYALDGIGNYIDLRAGADKGRLYRIKPIGKDLRSNPDLSAMSTLALVDYLRSPNGVVRDRAHRLLIEKEGIDAVPALEKLMEGDPSPKVRLQAMSVLNQLKALDFDTIPFDDSDPYVRKHALQISEPYLIQGEESGMKILELLSDPDEMVAYQAALSVRYLHSDATYPVLVKLLVDSENRKDIETAIYSTAASNPVAFLQSLSRYLASDPVSPELLGAAAGFGIVMAEKKGLIDALGYSLGLLVSNDPNDHAQTAWKTVATCLEEMNRRGVSWPVDLAENDPKLKAQWKELQTLFDLATTHLQSIHTKLTEVETLDHLLKLYGQGPLKPTDDWRPLLPFLEARYPLNVVQTAWERVRSMPSDGSRAQTWVGQWEKIRPEIRPQIIDWTLRDPSRALQFLQSVEEVDLDRATIGTVAIKQFLQHQEKCVRDKAMLVFGASISDRESVIRRFAGVLGLAGNPHKGQVHYQKLCMQCHRAGEMGQQVGPDLNTVSSQNVTALLRSILDPSIAVEESYTQYLVVLKSGDVITGLLQSETPSSVRIRTAAGTDETLMRNDMESMRAISGSLMPEGLEQGLSEQDMADLISFIRVGSVSGAR